MNEIPAQYRPTLPRRPIRLICRRYPFLTFAATFAATILISNPGRAQPASAPNPVIVAAGSAVPLLLAVDENVETPLELVAGRIHLPPIESVRHSLWVAGGPLLAPIFRGRPLPAESTTGQDGVARYRFRLPAIEAKPGAVLRLVIDGGDAQKVLAEVWLQVAERFDATNLRHWAAQHPLFIDPALKNLVAAFQEWRVPMTLDGEPALAIIGSEEALPSNSAVTLWLRQAKDGRIRLVVRPTPDGRKQVQAFLVNSDNIASDVTARRDFFAALREASALMGDNSNLSLP